MGYKNIYENCVSNSEIFYRDYDKYSSWDEQLDTVKEYYEKKGYKVIFVFFANSFMDAARVVLYHKNQTIPLIMQKYRYKYVKLNGHWILEGQLGICDKCGEYKPLICLCNQGMLCKDCDEED